MNCKDQVYSDKCLTPETKDTRKHNHKGNSIENRGQDILLTSTTIIKMSRPHQKLLKTKFASPSRHRVSVEYSGVTGSDNHE